MTLEEMQQREIELKSEIAALNNRQMALKILINSEYGALANPFFRYNDIRLASAITLSGQLIIRHIEEYFMNHPLQKKYKWEVVYSDTDSIYLSIDRTVELVKKKYPNISEQELLDKIDIFAETILQPIIDKGYDMLAEYLGCKNRMVMKREKIIASALWTAKKKYAMMVWDNEGVRYPKPKISFKGLQVVQSSTPKVIRDKLKHSIEILLNDKDELAGYVKENRQNFESFSAEDIAFPRSVNQIRKWIAPKTKNQRKGDKWIKRTPIQVKSSIVYNNWVKENKLEYKYELIREGEKIKFIYLIEPNPLDAPVVAYKNKFPEEFREFIDYDTMYHKTFLKVLENIKKVCITPIKLVKETDLFSFFKKRG